MRRTVERLDLTPGKRVLDVCCGACASAIPAAEAVGASGSVLGVDLADQLLDLARRKAAQSGLTNVEFRVGDLLELGMPESSFDAVICVFGIFFVPDMDAAVRALWQVVAPGGTLALTVWGPRWVEPGNTAFWEAVGAERPDLVRRFNPWERITEPDAVRALLRGAGIAAAEVILEPETHVLRTPDDWWTLVLGTGYRGTVDALDPDMRERVRRRNLDFIRVEGVRAVEVNVVYAVATKAT